MGKGDIEEIWQVRGQKGGTKVAEVKREGKKRDNRERELKERTAMKVKLKLP